MLALAYEDGLTQLQRGFAEAIFSDDAPIPAAIHAASGPAAASRFGVYRNNVIAGLMRALAARYPAVRKLLWDDAFNRAARLYIAMEPPRSPVLCEYGDGFPDFLRTIGQGAATDCVADVAALEAARTRAYHAADAVPLGPAAFALVTPEQWAYRRVALHPSTVLLRSPFPVVSLWEANLFNHDNDNLIAAWQPEPALVARPDLDVEVRRLSMGECGFIAALAAGQTVGEAMMIVAEQASDFDLSCAFATLISARIVVGLVRAGPDN